MPKFFIASLWILLTLPAFAQEPRVEYIVRLDRPQTQTVTIEILLRDVDRDRVELVMPTWRPGRYMILDPAGTVRWFRATDADGDELAWEKTRKNHWSIATGGASQIRATYELYANSIGDRTRHVDASHAFLSGSSVFMFDPERRSEPALIRIIAPDAWRVATGLEPEADDPRVLIAPDYDVLVDSPLEIGEHELIEFDVDGVRHQIAIWGEGDWDDERLKEDFSNIVRDQSGVFGDMPYERYVFLMHVGEGLGGGTEHINSTIMQTRPSSFESPKSYRGFLGLVSHEFFHTWNVKRLRPAGINPYDYDTENYTELLWVAEGTTSYYDDLTLVRTGLIDVREYLDRIGGSMNSFDRQPGGRVQSLEESSYDAWIKFSHRTPDSGNTTVSFYQKGALVSLLLDLDIRSRTDGRVSLDSVMRDLYERFPLAGPGFSPGDFREAVERLTGADYTAFFDSYVSGVEPLAYDDLLASVGLRRTFKPNEDPWAQEEEEQVDDGDDDALSDEVTTGFVQRASLGVSLTTSSGRVLVRSVRDTDPAFEAGVIADDELIAINGKRVTGTAVEKHLEGVEPGEAVTLTLARRGRVFELEVVAAGAPDGSWKLGRVDDPTDAQKGAYESWLGQPWPESDDEDGETGDDDSGASD